MFKEYEKRYENVFNVPNGKRWYFDKRKMSILGNEYRSLEEYKNAIRDEVRKHHIESFNQMVKIFWLLKKFTYGGYRRYSLLKSPGALLTYSTGHFTLKIVGIETAPLIHTYSYMDAYLELFYPNFEERNPFKESCEFPYKFITPDYLRFVYQMDERMELLKIAEERKLTYMDFLDYVLNHVACVNEERGFEYYRFRHTSTAFRRIVKFKQKTVYNIDGMKICTMCKEKKPVNCFGPHQTSGDKLRSRCNICRSKYEAKLTKKYEQERRKIETNSI